MDIVYRRGRASAYDILADMADPPSYSAIRTLIRILEERGHLRHRSEQGRYIYSPTRPRRQAARSALRRVTQTFFNNSAEHAIAALLDESALSTDSLDRLQKLIDQARKEEPSS
jgi:predicted transcriptional regulator